MKSAAFCAILLISSIFGAVVPKLERRVEPGEVENAREKLIFLAEKMLVLKTECKLFREVNWNFEVTNYFVDTLESLVTVEANATLLVALGPHAAEEKQKIMDKLAYLDTSLHNLRTQIYKISEKLRLDQFAEISEHFLQFKMISSEIADEYTKFQGALSYVINDLELAVLLAINGIDHPNIPDVYKLLQQSKDAANNANQEVTDAEQLYRNARTEAEMAVDMIVGENRSEQFFETRPDPVQKQDVLSYRLKRDAELDNVLALQFDSKTWTEHLINLNAKFSRLNNAMRLQISDSFLEIFRSMRELQVDEGIVSEIETDSSIDGQQLELTIGTLWNTTQDALVTLAAFNYELNYIDKYTHDNLWALRDILKDTHIVNINAGYDSVFSTIDMNLPVTMANIKNSILGMSGDPVIRIHLALQVIENAFDATRQDVTSGKPIYDENVTHTLTMLDLVIDDLCTGLFC